MAQEIGLGLIRAPVRIPADVLAGLEGLDGRVDLLWSVADSTVFTPPLEIEISRDSAEVVSGS